MTHTPWVSESERFVEVLAGTFLGEAGPAR
jgi:hypothetical protein